MGSVTQNIFSFRFEISHRTKLMLELLAGILLIAGVLWSTNAHYLRAILFAVALLVVFGSIIWQKNFAELFGKPNWLHFGIIVGAGLVVGGTMVLLGIKLGSFRFQPKLLKAATYVTFALLQEVGSAGYILKRFEKIFDLHHLKTASATAAVFGFLHLPKLFLAALTLPFAVFTTSSFLRTRNIWGIWIFHCIVGIALPCSFHINMGVGIHFR